MKCKILFKLIIEGTLTERMINTEGIECLVQLRNESYRIQVSRIYFINLYNFIILYNHDFEIYL